KKKDIKNPTIAKHNKMAYVTEDRKESGLVLPSSVQDNISLPFLKELSKGLIIQEHREQVLIKKMVDFLKIRTPSLKQIVSRLSGGNQQKVVLAKWLLTEPKILLLDEPTRGIDVGAKREIYAFMSKFASEGNCIIMISSELPEVMGMSDKIVIFKAGEMVGERKREEFDQSELMYLASE
ncbi:MAG: ATP-binding cassette domain-containing protein, partial [Sphaerochaetaceae bacterium]